MSFPLCVPTAGFRLFDFQGHVLDLANSVNPVISQTRNVPDSVNQQWGLAQVNTGNFVLASGVGQAVGHAIVLSWDTSSGAENPVFAQALGLTNTGLAFAVKCLNSTSGSLIDGATGVALTAWQAKAGSTISPVTFETSTGRAQQVWTFEALD
ncbi:hypothetical protein B0H19DRAFT_1060577 [Mycena capillaripes]|nr:hypothetical protein B0H19DRAFT_1060577 [Mycena capillaripes]